MAAWLPALALDDLSARGAEPVPRPGQGASAGKKTIWDGVFTEAQAVRGKTAYAQSCAACHKEDLLGDNTAPPLAGTEFAARWTGSTVDDVAQTIKRSMPQDAPDSLPPRVYVDIVSYLLQVNGGSPGAAELPIERAALAQILVTSPQR
jgi:mono/diheme cytochrome c family protein